jgi:hypothetical protein
MQGDERRPLHVPVRLLQLRSEIKRIGKMLLQNGNDFGADIVRQSIFGGMHGKALLIKLTVTSASLSVKGQ